MEPEVAVIVAEPFPTAVTTPDELTVATAVLLDVHVTAPRVAPAFGVAVNVVVSPEVVSVVDAWSEELVTEEIAVKGILTVTG